MDQKAERLKKHIDLERTQLRNNLYEIEDRVKEVVDLRSRYYKNPLIGVGIAFAGGLLLSRFAGGSKGQAAKDSGTESLFSAPLHKVSGTLDAIVGAFAGLATNKIEDLIAQAVPGFREEFEKAISREPSSGSPRRVAFG